MRILRSLQPFLAVCAVALVGALPAFACPGFSGSYLSGKFDASGNFVVSAMLDSEGKAVESAAGFVCETITMEDGLALTADSHADQTIWVVGNVDFDKHSLHVLSYTDNHGQAMATVASSCGTGSKAKADHAVMKSASAKGAGCCPSSASAGKSCGSTAKAASAQTAGSGCGSAAKAASAQTAGSGCTPGCTKPCGPEAAAAKSVKASAPEKVEGRQVVFSVSGMTCGGCTSKVQSAVRALEIPGMKGCEVNLDAATAIVTVSEDQEIDAEVIAKAITAVGFPAELVETEAKS